VTWTPLTFNFSSFAALLLYGMVFSTCFNGYDAGIMTVILADKQFIEYYSIDANRSGLVATIPWAMTGIFPSGQLSFLSFCIAKTNLQFLIGLAQLWLGGFLAGWLGRLWALRISICIMIIGV
jgi:hypothetical protein